MTRSTFSVMVFAKKILKHYIRTTTEEYQALSAVLSLTGTGCSLKLEIYRMLFQMFISCLLSPRE